ncbi:MAG: type II secretion system F family protein [Paracoccaceae bacterium]|jgi:tight adherence protein C|nr:type II secretion system F family protein [Paracoccaceae bacterium]MDP7185893.1 type II secretion system F family protein [Paracoccaceae bacterium]
MDILFIIQDILTGALGPFGPLIAVGTIGAILILGAVLLILRQPADPMEKLARRESGRHAEEKTQKSRLRTRNDKDKLQKYSSLLEPQDEETYSAIRLRLLQAGYRSKGAVRMFHFLQFALFFGGLVLGAGYAILNGALSEETTSTAKLVISIVGPGGAGYMAPKIWVNKRLAARQQEIIDGFPDSLDMMLICVEAGQSLDQTILRVARELRSAFPDLAEEYEIVAHEMKAGKDRTAVLRDMAERTGVQDVSSFVTVLIQSQTFGTSIADSLRVYSDEMRDKRVMRAEEKANKIPTKMTLATMMLTVPPLIILLVGPSVYDIYTMMTTMSI